MVGNWAHARAGEIRALRARLTLLIVDDDGMSTVEYSMVHNYTHESPGRRTTDLRPSCRTPRRSPRRRSPVGAHRTVPCGVGWPEAPDTEGVG
jgi:hypothetical protein